MSRTGALKLVHFAGTAWFIVSAGYLLFYSLLQSRKNIWLIILLSGYSALAAFLLTNLYLFVVFRRGGQKIKIEHPLTASIYYAYFYGLSPLLGMLAGVFGAIGSGRVSHYLLATAIGCLTVTFLAWIIIDPLFGLAETFLPSSRKNRQRRIAYAKAEKKAKQIADEHLLARIEMKQAEEKKHWARLLGPYAEELILPVNHKNPEKCESKAVDIGLRAWRMGGASCMKQLHSMATKLYYQRYKNKMPVDYISIWWVGIGSWRSPWPEEKTG